MEATPLLDADEGWSVEKKALARRFDHCWDPPEALPQDAQQDLAASLANSLRNPVDVVLELIASSWTRCATAVAGETCA